MMTKSGLFLLGLSVLLIEIWIVELTRTLINIAAHPC